MRKSFIAFLLVFFVVLNVRAFADFPISQGLMSEYEAAPKAAYNSQNKEFLVVWNAFNILYPPTDPNFFGPVRGQRIKESGELIGTPFDIFTGGVLADIVYNAQNNQYLVVCEQWYNTVGQRLDASGNKIGGQVTLMSWSRFPRVIYNSLLHNYLVTGVAASANPEGNCDIYTTQVDAYGNPMGSPTNVTTGYGASCDGAIYSIAYAPLEAPDSVYGYTPTPGGRYLLAVGNGPKDPILLNYQGKPILTVYDPDHGTWYKNVPFQPQGLGENYNIDVAFGYHFGNPVFFFVWSDIGSHTFCQYPWKGVMGGLLDAGRTFFLYTDPIQDKPPAFPISWIKAHQVDKNSAIDWKAKVVYNATAQKFVVAWRETPGTDPSDATVNHIRVNTWGGGVCPPEANIVVSSTTGTENPTLPFIASSTTSSTALVGWVDVRYLIGRIFGTLLDTLTRQIKKNKNDFNGDGKADILWRNTSGAVAIWLMNGTNISSVGNAGTVASSWQIEGVGDFNGDGKADILWRNTSGAVAIWLMNGTNISSVGNAGTVASSWQIEGVGDFNGDGKADILWRNTSGAVAIWLMNGTNISSVGNAGTVASSWQIEGVGDFNGDGKADILWRNTSGAVAIWLMNGTNISSVGNAGTVASSWQIEGVGDFNGDGKADILWRNTSGAVAIWLMNGTNISSVGNAGTVASSWQIEGVGDFNGDGKADILWRNTSGAVAIWLMNGTNISSVGNAGTVASSWQIVEEEYYQ